jgi:hypothetical protein
MNIFVLVALVMASYYFGLYMGARAMNKIRDEKESKK